MAKRKSSESPFAIYCWLLQVLIVLSLTAVVIWLSTKPRNPKFTITAIHIPVTGNRNLTKVQANDVVRNNSVVFDLEIRNPNNGMTICYVEIDLKVYNGGVIAGGKSLGSFCQGRKKSVTEEVLIDADRVSRAGNAGGGAGLRVTVETKVKYHIFKWKTKVHRMSYEGFVKIGAGWNITESIYLHKM